MRLARKALGLGLGLAASFATALPARAVEATLVADAHVNTALPSVNSGTISNLYVGAGYTSLLEFDLAVLPAGTNPAQVSKAVLRLYLNRVDVAGQVAVQPVNAAWGEYSVTYATLPALGSPVQTVSASQAGSYVTVDVTALVQGWIADPASNHGLALAADTAAVQFDSKENDLSGHAAVLDVTLASMGPQGPAGPIGSTGLTGPGGAVGSTGATGSVGATGPVGLPGATGPKGDSGAAGPAGATGTQGLPGAPGATGPVGPIGATGLAGATGSAGATGAPGSIGPGGPAGQPGISFQGSYLPVANYGKGDAVIYQGSSYISLVASNHGNTPGSAPSAWSVLAAAGSIGAPGPAGASGATGSQGATGPQGAQGVAGPAGAVGMNDRGSWNAGLGYQSNDAASFAGSTYLALAASSGMEPDLYPSAWTVLAARGNAGPTGPSGVAAAVSIGTVTTGAAGSQAAVTNSGTPTVAVLNFTIPQGAAGTGGTGGGSSSASGAVLGSMYHAVSFTNNYYSVSNTNANASEDTSVLTWLPAGCAATTLNVYSKQSAQITVALREGTPGGMVDSGLACTAASGGSCAATGGTAIAAGSFVDFHVTGESGSAAAVWMALGCS